MSVRPIRQVYAELEQEVKTLATPEPPRGHIKRVLALVADMRVSLNDIEYHAKVLQHALQAYDHFQIDTPEEA